MPVSLTADMQIADMQSCKGLWFVIGMAAFKSIQIIGFNLWDRLTGTLSVAVPTAPMLQGSFRSSFCLDCFLSVSWAAVDDIRVCRENSLCWGSWRLAILLLCARLFCIWSFWRIDQKTIDWLPVFTLFDKIDHADMVRDDIVPWSFLHFFWELGLIADSNPAINPIMFCVMNKYWYRYYHQAADSMVPFVHPFSLWHRLSRHQYDIIFYDISPNNWITPSECMTTSQPLSPRYGNSNRYRTPIRTPSKIPFRICFDNPVVRHAPACTCCSTTKSHSPNLHCKHEKRGLRPSHTAWDKLLRYFCYCHCKAT